MTFKESLLILLPDELKVILKLLLKRTKSIISKIKSKLWPSKRRVISDLFSGKISLRNVVHSQYNYSFCRDESVILAGSTWRVNFGDALNVPLFQKFCALNVIEANCISNKNNDEFMMIGSVLNQCNSNTLIWGSGIISKNLVPKIKPKTIFAVRGPLTREILINMDIDCPEIYGDPALLLPFVYSPTISEKRKYKLGVIPHYIDKSLDIIEKLKDNSDVLIIDIDTGRDWKHFINEIHKCDSIISSSLHGVIVADAYNVPNLWVEFSRNVYGNGFKFLDYYASVKRNVTKPLNLIEGFELELIYQLILTWKPIEFDHLKLIKAFPYKTNLSNLR